MMLAPVYKRYPELSAVPAIAAGATDRRPATYFQDHSNFSRNRCALLLPFQISEAAMLDRSRKAA